VAELAAAIASDLGWEATRVVRLREAALLHDIGWVAVPPDVRARRGPLTTDQRLIIRDHVGHGAMIAAGVLDEEQVSWIRFHHERWDGGGYPDGLVGEVIPDGARIIAVADAWVAMTSPREYRPTLSGARALEEFRAEASAQFAPEAVDALERVMASTDSGVTSVPT
jgi:HD-GYP domain-containing protein (c-di-GMP phosphodiesterase class II)